jgi:hypothetical protein
MAQQNGHTPGFVPGVDAAAGKVGEGLGQAAVLALVMEEGKTAGLLTVKVEGQFFAVAA